MQTGFFYDQDGKTLLFRDPRGGGVVQVQGYDPNTGTIKWRGVGTPFTGSTKLTPEMSSQYTKLFTTGTDSPAGDKPPDGTVSGGGFSVQFPKNPTDSAGNTDSIDALIQQFLAELKNPINADSQNPYVQSIIKGSATQAQNMARSRGIEGGLSAAATQQNVGGAIAGLEGQRQDRYAQALGMASNRDISKQQQLLNMQRLAEEQYQYDNSLAMQSHGQSGLGAGLGMLGGGLASLGLGFIPGIGPAAALKAAPGLMSMGTSWGQGIESGFAGPYRPPARSSYSRKGYY